MQTFLRLFARLIVARQECTYVRHCKEIAPIYMYYVPETPMMSSVIADCPDLVPPNILDKSTPMTIGQRYSYNLNLLSNFHKSYCSGTMSTVVFFVVRLCLNRQAMLLLSGLGVSDETFFKLQDSMLLNMADILFDEHIAVKEIAKVCAHMNNRCW